MKSIRICTIGLLTLLVLLVMLVPGAIGAQEKNQRGRKI